MSIRNKRQRHYSYLCYFSITMIFYNIFTVLDVVDFYMGEYIDGSIGCKISHFFKEFTLMITTFILLWISFDQYIYVFYSTNYAKILPRVNVNILCTAIFGLILSIPYPIIYHVRLNECKKRICRGDYSGFFWKAFFLCLQTIFYYFIPICFMIFFYCKILIYLKRKSNKIRQYSGSRSRI
ncbi:hypothetical protein HZS_4684 [Henneguya salminicola]|nr:hypothetical protein HZS_4684 [Henneguya salminicola]